MCFMSADDLNIGFYDLSVCFIGRGPMTKPVRELRAGMMACFSFNTDISYLLPYINAAGDQARLFDNPYHVRFVYDGVHCVLYPYKCMITPFDDKEQASAFVIRLIAFLNELKDKRFEIVPKHTVFAQASIPEILKILPGTNCGDCSFPTCMAFAAGLSKQQAVPDQCPHIKTPMQEKVVFPVHDKNGNLISTLTLDVDSDQKSNHGKVLSDQEEDICKAANKALISPLTKREIQVLQMVAQGATNPEISDKLFISPHTVKSHVDNIFNKLGVNSRTKASVWASRNKFV